MNEIIEFLKMGNKPEGLSRFLLPDQKPASSGPGYNPKSVSINRALLKSFF
jgi:hypothetical protein